MNNEQLKEEIKLYTELLKLIGTAIFILASGVFSLILVPVGSGKVFIIAFIGMVLVLLLALIFVSIFRRIRRLIKKLKV